MKKALRCCRCGTVWFSSYSSWDPSRTFFEPLWKSHHLCHEELRTTWGSAQRSKTKLFPSHGREGEASSEGCRVSSAGTGRQLCSALGAADSASRPAVGDADPRPQPGTSMAFGLTSQSPNSTPQRALMTAVSGSREASDEAKGPLLISQLLGVSRCTRSPHLGNSLVSVGGFPELVGCHPP